MQSFTNTYHATNDSKLEFLDLQFTLLSQTLRVVESCEFGLQLRLLPMLTYSMFFLELRFIVLLRFTS